MALTALRSPFFPPELQATVCNWQRRNVKRQAVAALPSTSTGGQQSTVQKSNTTKRVVILGGSGRIGSSTAAALIALRKAAAEGDQSTLNLTIGGRNRERGEKACNDLESGAVFVPCDVDDYESIVRAIDGADLVVHTAGPFQRREECIVLEAAIATRTPYMDVCDDRDYSQRAKQLHAKAQEAGVPAITTAGIYPGVSNSELVRLAGTSSPSSPPKSLRYSYFTAGTGGAGPTILATSFLLLGEPALAYLDGKEVEVKAYSGHKVVDFGKIIGRRSVYLLNLPEVGSAHSVLGLPSVSARFGTAPQLWNWGMQLMALLVPPEVLKSRSAVEGMVARLDPVVRLVDGLAGERVAMRVDLECDDGTKTVALYSHKYLSKSVGQSTAAFALAMLEGATQPGVWFPEEEEGVSVDARQTLLQRASKGTTVYAVNTAPWVIEAPVKNFGFGLYW
eukprot:jgi/Mesen1/2486/ME000159S01610